MHQSYFQIIGSEFPQTKELTLDGEVSEWLVCTHFWDQINEQYGTFFGQYEEECLPSELTNDLVKSLRAVIAQLERSPEQFIRFRYGWNEKKEEMECSIEIGQLKLELERLSNFFSAASTMKSGVYCQL